MLWFALAALFYSGLVRADDDYEENPDDFVQFITRPDIVAFKWDIQMYDEDELQPGYYWFIAPYDNVFQEIFPRWNGPHIYDMNGELIWAGASHLDYINVYDFRMAEVNGQKMLSYIWGKEPGGNGQILNNSYELNAIVDMTGNSSGWNPHELNLIDDGERALMATYQVFNKSEVDLPEYKGPCWIGQQGFKEVEVKTGTIIFEWNALDHIRLEESTHVHDDVEHDTWEEKCALPLDAVHVNSVEKFDDGDYLISARHTDTIYKISHKDHSIVWRFGGQSSDFVIRDQRINFGRQHDTRIRGQNETHILISFFNNGSANETIPHNSTFESWGMFVALRTDVTPMTAELIARYEKPFVGDAHTINRGSMDILPNGNAFVGWVSNSHLCEYSPDGRLLMSAMVNETRAETYRSFKMAWIGLPAQPPDVVAQARIQNNTLRTFVFVSWNGATEVATWNVLRTNSFGNISTLVASSQRQGFETTLILDEYVGHIITVALDKDGQEVRRSEVIATRIPEDLQSPSLAESDKAWADNHALAWWEPEPVYLGWANLDRLAICAVLCCLGIGLWIWRRSKRRDRSWWVARHFAYQSLNDDDRDGARDERTWTMREKE